VSESWLKDRAVVEWFNLINAKLTKVNYTREFPKFLEFAQKTTKYRTPTQIIASRLEQKRSTDQNVSRYWEDVGKKFAIALNSENYRLNTKISFLRTMMSFFSKHHARLEYSRGELFGLLEPSESEKVSAEWIPSNEEVRLLYRMANSSRDRAILLVLYQSGFSEVDLTEMKIEQFPFYDDEGSWDIPISEDLYHPRLREKTNIEQKTCISREALEEIRIMLQQRGFPKEGSLFVSMKQQKTLDVRELHDILKTLVERAFNGKVKLWKTKHLRDAFMNACLQAKIPQEVKDSMVGHKRQGAREAYALTEQTIKTAYSEAFKFLTINGFGSQGRKIEELEKQFTEQLRAMTAIMTELRNENSQLKQQLAQTSTETKEMIGKIDERLTYYEKHGKKKPAFEGFR
jgi:site-specific recombinase XerD